MQAQVTKLQKLLEGTHQYVVPLFQREYSWTQKEWHTFWSDVVDLAEDDGARSHFIGSIVTMPTKSVPEGVAKYVLIDGQQRLTTIFVLLAAVRDQARESMGKLATRIENQLLTNQYDDGLDAQKLMPTQVDRDAFFAAIRGEPILLDGALNQARRYFARRLAASGAPTLDAIVTTILSDFLVVSIVLDKDDDPYLIFESLNAKGRPLTQADLIRNYFLMKVELSAQDQLYHELWRPMQESLGTGLTEFIRHYLMMNGAIIKQADLYYELKQRTEGMAPSEIEAYLAAMTVSAGHYAKMLSPENEPDARIRDRLGRLKRLDVTVAYPFVLNVYADLVNGQIDANEFVAVLDVVENFLIRRFVCGFPTTGLNKEFPLLYGQAAQSGNLVEGTKEALRTKRYPRDAEFADRFASSKLYGGGNRLATTRLILERLEAAFQHKEQVSFDVLTIEHLMPQTITDWWRSHLGDQWEITHETLVDTIGNLTLTAYNPNLSNANWLYKRSILDQSHVELSRSLHALDRWDELSIQARATALVQQALSIWPYFGKTQDDAAPIQVSVTGRLPVAIVILGVQTSVQTWRDVAQETMETIINLDDERFYEVMERFPRMLTKDPSRLRSNRQLSNGVFLETHLSADAIYRFCLQAAEVAELSADDWKVEFRDQAQAVAEPSGA